MILNLYFFSKGFKHKFVVLVLVHKITRIFLLEVGDFLKHLVLFSVQPSDDIFFGLPHHNTYLGFPEAD
jgi:hypothetical protein